MMQVNAPDCHPCDMMWGHVEFHSESRGARNMTTDQQIEFHSDRAMAELDLALTASCIQAAQAHFGLSALHLDKMRDLKRRRSLQDAAGV